MFVTRTIVPWPSDKCSLTSAWSASESSTFSARYSPRCLMSSRHTLYLMKAEPALDDISSRACYELQSATDTYSGQGKRLAAFCQLPALVEGPGIWNGFSRTVPGTDAWSVESA